MRGELLAFTDDDCYPREDFVDEVLKGFDCPKVGYMVFQSRYLEKMTALARQGTTLLFASHSLKSVTDLCDRATLLERGARVFGRHPARGSGEHC